MLIHVQKQKTKCILVKQIHSLCRSKGKYQWSSLPRQCICSHRKPWSLSWLRFPSGNSIAWENSLHFLQPPLVSLGECQHDAGATFVLARVHSLSWLCICLHENVIPAQVTPRLYQNENFTPVRNFVAVSCKCKMTTLLVWNRSAVRLEWVTHAKCLPIWMARVFYEHEVYHHTNVIWNDSVIT